MNFWCNSNHKYDNDVQKNYVFQTIRGTINKELKSKITKDN
jgi:hypothetical protein